MLFYCDIEKLVLLLRYERSDVFPVYSNNKNNNNNNGYLLVLLLQRAHSPFI